MSHPVARTSALLIGGGQSYPLDGLPGIAGRPAQELQAYIAAHGDMLMCQPGGGRYLCTLPDGTDLAKVALINGAARVSDDAPGAYRQQQALAQEAHRGIWAVAAASQAGAVTVGPPVIIAPLVGYAVDDAAGPVTNAGEQPTVVIDGDRCSSFMAMGWAGATTTSSTTGAAPRNGSPATCSSSIPRARGCAAMAAMAADPRRSAAANPLPCSRERRRPRSAPLRRSHGPAPCRHQPAGRHDGATGRTPVMRALASAPHLHR